MKFRKLVIGVFLFCGVHVYAQSGNCEAPVIPDIITPNHDGFNDVLIISCIEFFPTNELQVFNRWGQQIYHAFGYDNNWGGTWDQTGGDLPDGTYYYVFIATINNEEKTFNGHITISR